MIDGITVLNSFEVVSKTAFGWNAFCICAIIGAVIATIVSFIDTYSISEYFFKLAIAVVVIGGVFGLLGGCVRSKPVEYESQWEVTIDETVSMNEFYSRYEVVEQRGEIYVIREKENEK